MLDECKKDQNNSNVSSSNTAFRNLAGLLSILLAALIVTGINRTHAGSNLTAKQIRAEIIGKWLTYKGIKDNAQLIYKSSGKVWARSTANRYAAGTWKLKGNRFCTKMNFRNYREVCSSISRSGKGYMFHHKGRTALFWLN